jgi:hypothetical protein
MPDSSTDNSKLFGGSKDYSWARLICGTIPLIIWLPGNHKASRSLSLARNPFRKKNQCSSDTVLLDGL